MKCKQIIREGDKKLLNVGLNYKKIKKYNPERQIRISVFTFQFIRQILSKIKQTQRYNPEIQIRISIFTFQVI